MKQEFSSLKKYQVPISGIEWTDIFDVVVSSETAGIALKL